jgi:hypothetical protein
VDYDWLAAFLAVFRTCPGPLLLGLSVTGFGFFFFGTILCRGLYFDPKTMLENDIFHPLAIRHFFIPIVPFWF